MEMDSKMQRCELCSVEVPDAVAFGFHIAGKRHQKNMNNKIAESNSKMQRCELCSVEVPDAIAFGFHIAGKRHQKNEKIHMNNKIAERSIFVAPLPQYIPREELINFFLQFGKINNYSFRQHNVIIEFDSKEPVDFLVHKTIWIQNTKLNIRRKLIRDKKPEEKTTSPESSNCLAYENLKHIFEENPTFESQLNAFLNAVLLSDTEVDAQYKAITGHLDRVFRYIFPKYRVYKFGSMQTGLGFKESDLDFYVDIGEPIFENADEQQPGWTTQKIFRDVKRMMYRMNAIFSNIVPIPRAKIPIIKFRYVPTNISCDISFKSGLGMYNSDFIRFCLSLDVRLKPLMIILKYWARHIEVSGTGKISNYALVMLVFFYLQQPSVRIFPPIYELQQNCERILINGWQVNYNKNIVLPPPTNNSSIPELLQGFFEFYANFNYKGNVICPIDGKVHDDEEFKRGEGLPESMARYKINVRTVETFAKFPTGKPISVQDPFELNCNVTGMTAFRVLDAFRKNCATGMEICEAEKKDDNKNLFTALFTACVRKEQKREAFVYLPCNPFIKVGLPEDFETRTDIVNKEQFIIDHWFCTTFRIVKDAFEKVMRLHVEILSVDNEKKQQKINALSDVHTMAHQRIIMRLTGNDCVWFDRKSCQTILDPSMSCLEKEIAITDRVMRSSRAQKIRMDFLCRFDKKTDPLAIGLLLSDNNCQKNSFKQVAEFIRTRIPKIVDRTFIHMRQYSKRY